MSSRKNDTDSEKALVFVNGSYQFIVGLACARKYVPNASMIEVIGYDMIWQKELRRVVQEAAECLNVSYRDMPCELPKSNADYSKTHILRSLWNQFFMWLFVKQSSAQHIFLPKIFNNPEIAMIAGAKDKHVYIFDDGLAIYIGGIFEYQYRMQKAGIDFGPRLRDIKICPANPMLFDASLPSGCVLQRTDYTDEVGEIAKGISDCLDFDLPEDVKNKKIVLLCFIWISVMKEQNRFQEIEKFIDEIIAFYPEIVFLMKPHPREDPDAVENYFQNLIRRENCTLLDTHLWKMPVEILAEKMNARYVVSSVSTLAMNNKCFPNTTVIISDVFGHLVSEYSPKVLKLLDKLGVYYGDNVDVLIDAVKQKMAD